MAYLSSRIFRPRIEAVADYSEAGSVGDPEQEEQDDSDNDVVVDA